MSCVASSAAAPAPWRSTFLAHIRDMEPPSFVLSTIHALETTPSSSSSSSSSCCSSSSGAAGSLPLPLSLLVPRARTVVYRGMWASLPANPKNPATLNPDVYASDMPAVTTDARMEKVSDLLTSTTSTTTTRGKSQGQQQLQQQSGIGGPVEAVFWAEKAKTQWRFRGHAVVIGPDIESDAAAPVRDALRLQMRRTTPPPTPTTTSTATATTTTTTIATTTAAVPWSWSKELTAHFGNLSPSMRGSFRNPPPGTPLTDDQQHQQRPGPGLGLGQEVEDLHDEVARKNFRVLVIVPDEVDRVDLSDPKKGRRWNYKCRVEQQGSHHDDGEEEEEEESGTTWITTELWP